jgi:hypothetical protein
MAIESLEDLRPGDFMIGPIGGLAGIGAAAGMFMLGEVFRWGQMSARHAGIVVSGVDPMAPTSDHLGYQYPRLAQAMPGGAETVDMRYDSHWTPRHAYIRIPEDYPGQGEDAAAIARLMVDQGVGYSWASYPALAAYKFGVRNERIRGWINRRREPILFSSPVPPAAVGDLELPCEAICSVFADQAWSLTGKKLASGVQPQAVTPGKLLSALLSIPGTEVAYPREDYALTHVVE